MTTNDKPVCDRDVDLMRDVYMTREQRAAYNRILDAATRPQPAAPQVPEGWRLFDRVEFALRDAGFDYDEAFDLAQKATATPPAPEQPKTDTFDASEPWPGIDGVLVTAYMAGETGRALDMKWARAEIRSTMAEQPKPALSDHCAIVGCVHKQHGCPSWPEGTNPFQPKPAGDVEAGNG